jgi:hypothetical protein
MTDDGGLDVTGVGKLAKAIPAKAWNQLVDTACTTFRDAIAPLTATTSGLGRLITARFDRLVDAEKILAAENVGKAQNKIAKSNRAPSGKAKATIVIAAIEASGTQTDPMLRELWANLLAQEFVTADVHLEFPHILSRLSASDAQLLAQIADREHEDNDELKKIITKFSAGILGFSISVIGTERASFTHEHLHNLNLIERNERLWRLTKTGLAFIQSLTYP